MKFILILLANLNLLDACITHFGILGGHISEANLIMYSIYEIHPFLFLFVKTMLSIFLIVLIFLIRLPVSKIIQSLFICSHCFVRLCLFPPWLLDYTNFILMEETNVYENMPQMQPAIF
ncbi:DUF5658 family protein [Bacillus timonensis]|uniref:DUF5658 family protein n=1 Tax=Bacillus timonensis TaxID=1033734 RepID=UPI0026CE334B